MRELLILGCGYLGERLARQYLDAGRTVTGLTRTEAGLARLARAGIPGRRFDLSGDWPPDLSFAGVELFHLVPPPDSGAADPLTHRLVEGFAQAGTPRRIVYVGTTGVYGDCQGAWIDENHPPNPTADRSRRRWDAEQTLRAWRDRGGGELVILRVAGIYGPGRLPLERLRAGTPMVRPEESPYTNRIHVDDLATVCRAAMARGGDGAVYNACDGHPGTMTEYFLQVAAAAGLPPPPLIPLAAAPGQVSAGMLSYLAESRRLSNRRLLDDLGVTFRYPTLDDGLAALFPPDRGAPEVSR